MAHQRLEKQEVQQLVPKQSLNIPNAAAADANALKPIVHSNVNVDRFAFSENPDSCAVELVSLAPKWALRNFGRIEFYRNFTGIRWKKACISDN
jgi:hypothetical protein